MSTARRAILTTLALLTTLTAFVACNEILGVQDVKLKRSRDSGGVDPGDGDVEPLGDGDTPTRANELQTVLGEAHTCARKPAGTVQCWGDDTQGQNGTGAPTDGGVVVEPRDLPDVTDAVDIAAGRNHTCVAGRNGSVSCWGYNLDGQLGNGESNNRRNTPVKVSNITNGIAVAAGGNFSCALRSSGTVVCWGGNGSGQLGKGDQSPSPTPAVVLDLGSVVTIAAGQAHACAVKADGSVWCWGDGQNGQLGSGSAQSQSKPVLVDNLPPATSVTAGDRSTCALTRTSSVYCWGANELGQLGTGASNQNANPAPIIVTNLGDALAIASGRNHTCAVRKAGTVVCWGAGARGALGDGQNRDGGAQPTFVPVNAIQDAIGAGAGGSHSCASLADSKVMCWGANDRGQLGDGTTGGALSPVRVLGF